MKTPMLIIVLIVTGCATSTLSPEGRGVKIVEPILVDAKECKSLGKAVYQTAAKVDGLFRLVVIKDLKNEVALKGANLASTTYPLRETRKDIPFGTPIPYEYFKCSRGTWDKLTGML